MTTATMDRAQRFPFPIPFGWFHIGFSADLAAGEQKILTRFGQELVLWRSQAGEFVLQDAYCPHLGAHFGHGGGGARNIMPLFFAPLEPTAPHFKNAEHHGIR